MAARALRPPAFRTGPLDLPTFRAIASAISIAGEPDSFHGTQLVQDYRISLRKTEPQVVSNTTRIEMGRSAARMSGWG